MLETRAYKLIRKLLFPPVPYTWLNFATCSQQENYYNPAWDKFSSMIIYRTSGYTHTTKQFHVYLKGLLRITFFSNKLINRLLTKQAYDSLQQLSCEEVRREHLMRRQPFHHPTCMSRLKEMMLKPNACMYIHIVQVMLYCTFGQAGQTFPASKPFSRKERCLISCLKNLQLSD